MKEFMDVAFDPAKCTRELKALGRLLRSSRNLAERTQIQRFFRQHHHLTAFLGSLAPLIGPATQIAYEFPFFGDFAADILLGNRERGDYCAVELEDARRNSIFTILKTKSTKEWSRRFEHGISQLVDWFRLLDDLKKTDRFARDFGPGHIKFFGLLLIGRNEGMSDDDRARLRWRTEKVLVNSHTISCLTFDDVFEGLSQNLKYFPKAPKVD